jgi:endonuclease G
MSHDALVECAFAALQHDPEGMADLMGVDFGFKYVRGESDGRTRCLRFFVKEKTGADELAPERRLPNPLLLPAPFGEQPTDVISLSPFDFPREGAPAPGRRRTERLNPLRPGISVSHPGLGSGTLGALVVCEETGELAVLSAAHVLAGRFARKGDPIYQPGVLDDADMEFDAIGYLEDWCLDEDGDAAIAVLNRTRMIEPELIDDSLAITGAATVELGEVLAKSGRGSNGTRGKVDGVGRYRLTLDEQTYWLQGFRLVSDRGKLSDPGDSGALWYRERDGVYEGIGLHVDGDRLGDPQEFGIACHLPRVLERLRVRLLQPGEQERRRKPVFLPEDLANTVRSMWDEAQRTALSETRRRDLERQVAA